MSEAVREGVAPITSATLPKAASARARAEWPFEVGLVRLDHLLVDDTYQRPIHEAFVKEAAENFDPTLIGTIDVSMRSPIQFAILDGQQRVRIMEAISDPKTACYCSIYTDMDISDEAAFFYRKNKDRRNMKPFYAFRARIVANEIEASLINDVVSAQGFVLGDGTNNREVIGAISAVETAYHFASDVRDESLSPTLEAIRESILGRKDSVSTHMITGLARFFQVFPDSELNQTALREVLSENGPQNIIMNGREQRIPMSAGAAPSMSICVARAVGTLYNRHINPGGRGTTGGRLDLRRLG